MGMGAHGEQAAGLTPDADVLPPFTVRRSARARQARLTVTPRDGAVLVLPEDLDIDPVTVVRDRRRWLEDALADLAPQRAIWLADPSTLLPDEIEFMLTGERWRVVYRSSDAHTVRAVTRKDYVVVSGAVGDSAECLRALHRWLHARARDRLLPLLWTEAARVGIRPTAASVRGQRARWGGCSLSGHITLNRALLFLGASLVRSVILHELAHLEYPDHSPSFWRLLSEIDPDAEANRVALREARDTVPAWAERH